LICEEEVEGVNIDGEEGANNQGKIKENTKEIYSKIQ
jgi:hypothetical protein